MSLTDKAKKCVKQISNLKASDIIGLSLCPTLWLAVKAVKKNCDSFEANYHNETFA
ncbi:MAG: hypothetical protein MSA74_01310 [Ruminococcus sp.]|nr:hypothetical protein [Ruminococcus sp.]